MKKIARKIVLPFFALLAGGLSQIVFSADSGTQNLTAAIHATDYFQITCSKSDNVSIGDTDHLNFQIFEASDTTPQAPQVLNLTLTKATLTASTSGIAANTSNYASLKGGNGAYKLSIDTVGTNLTLKKPQTYSLQYQCLNASGGQTTGSSTLAKQNTPSPVKTLVNKGTVKYLINCAKNTDNLKVTLSNKTTVAATGSTVTSTGTLSAQVISGNIAKNTIGSNLNVQNGNRVYEVLVSSPTNEIKNYNFNYSCLNANNVETKTSSLTVLQNQ